MFAPAWRARARLASLSAWTAVVVLLLVGGLRDPRLVGWLVPVVMVVLVLAAPYAAARVNARLVVRDEEVTYRGPLGGVHKCSRRAVVKVVRVQFAVLGPRMTSTRMLLLDMTGRAVPSVPEEWWSTRDVERITSAPGVPVIMTFQQLTPAEANRRYPGAASVALVHRVAVGTVVTCILVVVGLGVLGAVVGHR
jgi:hypothetical protein